MPERPEIPESVYEKAEKAALVIEGSGRDRIGRIDIRAAVEAVVAELGLTVEREVAKALLDDHGWEIRPARSTGRTRLVGPWKEAPSA